MGFKLERYRLLMFNHLSRNYIDCQSSYSRKEICILPRHLFPGMQIVNGRGFFN